MLSYVCGEKIENGCVGGSSWPVLLCIWGHSKDTQVKLTGWSLSEKDIIHVEIVSFSYR